MPSEQFLKDRRRTYGAQEFVADKLMAAGWDVRIVKDGYFPDYDIEAKNRNGEQVFIEVKRYYGFKNSGTFCLEIDSLQSKAAPSGRPLYLAVLVDDPEEVCYLCDLKQALRLALDYPVKGQFGEHGEWSALVPKKYLMSQVKLYKFV